MSRDENKGSHRNAPCPLTPVHTRLEDAHRLWHQARDAYQDPDAFRVAVQNCIATFRTVTFILQSNKSLIPEFDNWYEIWQEKMRSDELMIWAKNARNKIEKQGDLVTHSTITVSVIASYLDSEVPKMKLEVSVEDTLERIFSIIPKTVLDDQIVKHGVVKVERTWIDEELPEREILDAMSHVYGKLELMLLDAHRQMGLPTHEFTLMEHDGIISKFPSSIFEREGRLPCMIADHAHRTSYMTLADGQPLTAKPEAPPSLELAAVQKSLKRYGKERIHTLSKKFTDLTDAVDTYFKVARTMFSRDGYHVPIAMLFKNLRCIKILNTHSNNRAEKYIIMRGVAEEVDRLGATEVILINEVWLGKIIPDKPFQYPQDQPDREEALTLIADSSNGISIALEAKIRRRLLRKPILEETQRHEFKQPMLLAPVRDIWRRKQSN